MTCATTTEILILEQLSSAITELRGIDLVKNSSGDLKIGSMYVLLGRLEQKGHIVSHRIEKRRVYKITEKGKIELRAQQQAQVAYMQAIGEMP